MCYEDSLSSTETLDELYAITKRQMCIEGSLTRGKIPVHPKLNEVGQNIEQE